MKEHGTTGAGRPQITGAPRLHRHLECTHTTGNIVLFGRTSGTRPLTPRAVISRQYGDGRGEVISSFDGTDFRQYERRVRLFVSNTRVAERRAGKLLERLEGRAFDSTEIQDLETPNGVEKLLDHWKGTRRVD